MRYLFFATILAAFLAVTNFLDSPAFADGCDGITFERNGYAGSFSIVDVKSNTKKATVKPDDECVPLPAAGNFRLRISPGVSFPFSTTATNAVQCDADTNKGMTCAGSTISFLTAVIRIVPAPSGDIELPEKKYKGNWYIQGVEDEKHAMPKERTVTLLRGASSQESAAYVVTFSHQAGFGFNVEADGRVSLNRHFANSAKSGPGNRSTPGQKKCGNNPCYDSQLLFRTKQIIIDGRDYGGPWYVGGAHRRGREVFWQKGLQRVVVVPGIENVQSAISYTLHLAQRTAIGFNVNSAGAVWLNKANIGAAQTIGNYMRLRTVEIIINGFQDSGNAKQASAIKDFKIRKGVGWDMGVEITVGPLDARKARKFTLIPHTGAWEVRPGINNRGLFRLGPNGHPMPEYPYSACVRYRDQNGCAFGYFLRY